MSFTEYVDGRISKGEKRGAVIRDISEKTGITVQSLRLYYRGCKVGHLSNAQKISEATRGKCTLQDLGG